MQVLIPVPVGGEVVLGKEKEGTWVAGFGDGAWWL